MARIFHREPATPTQTQPQRATRTRPAATAAPQNRGAFGRLRTNIDDISAELRKVTWPTREETRNLTIVVIAISATIGILLWAIDVVLSFFYNGASNLITGG